MVMGLGQAIEMSILVIEAILWKPERLTMHRMKLLGGLSPYGAKACADFGIPFVSVSSYSHSVTTYIHRALHQFGEHASPALVLEQPAGHGARESNCQSNRASVSQRNTSVRIAVLGSTIPLLWNNSLLLMLICGHPASINVSVVIGLILTSRAA